MATYRKIICIMPTYNSERTIKLALKTVSLVADKIIIVDSGSVDNTIKIAQRFNNVLVINTNIKNDFSYIRNLALKLVSEGDFVLCIDSDEYMNKELIVSLLKLKKVLHQIKIRFLIGCCDRLMPLVIGNKTYIYREKNRMVIFRKTQNIKYIGKVYEVLIVNHLLFERIAHKFYLKGSIIHTPRTAPEYLKKRISRLDILLSNLIISERHVLKREKYLANIPPPIARLIYSAYLLIGNMKTLLDSRKGDFLARLWLWSCDIIVIFYLTIKYIINSCTKKH